ncbi:MAG: hypothetical protein QME60_05280 [Verrucomicrobiota bacterium]|nr:hypothetical protein [Verrucomicrobiota bacterium]
MKNPWYLIIWVLIAFGWYSTLGGDVNLRVQIEEIRRSSSTSNEVDRTRIEKELIDLLAGNAGPERRGTVYAAIANVYSSDLAHHAESAAHYAREAIKNQLSIADTCDMYLCLGNAAEIQARTEGSPNAINREMQAAPFIQGLAFVLGHLRTEKSLPPPPVGKYDVEPKDPQYEETVRQHEKQIAVRDDVLLQNRLLVCRDDFSRRVIQLYPLSLVNDKSALTRIVRETVGNADKAEKVLFHLNADWVAD